MIAATCTTHSSCTRDQQHVEQSNQSFSDYNVCKTLTHCTVAANTVLTLKSAQRNTSSSSSAHRAMENLVSFALSTKRTLRCSEDLAVELCCTCAAAIDKMVRTHTVAIAVHSML
eukprot:15631-Heterococcus_DN1.PRE.2